MMSGERKSSGASAGFTLVELLASLTITSLLATFAIAGIEWSQRVWQLSRAADVQSELDAGAARLIELISNTVPAAAFDPSTGTASVRFQGHGDRLNFVTLSEGYTLRGGLIETDLRWLEPQSNSSGAGAIVVQTRVFRSKPDQIQPDEPIVLLDHVSRLRIRYFGTTESGKPPQWHDDWLKRQHLPLLIGVDLEVSLEKEKRELQLRVPLRLTGG